MAIKRKWIKITMERSFNFCSTFQTAGSIFGKEKTLLVPVCNELGESKELYVITQ